MGTEEVVLGVAWWSSINGFLCPQSCTSGGPIVHTTTGGDLLRSVLHIKFGDKIKSHRYLDKSG